MKFKDYIKNKRNWQLTKAVVKDTLEEELKGFYKNLKKNPAKALVGSLGLLTFFNSQLLFTQEANAQEKRTEYLIPVIQDSSNFYPTILEHLVDESGNEINRFERPINVFIDPQFQNNGIRAKIINAANSINGQKPNTVSIVSDTLTSRIDFMHKEDAFGEIERSYNQDGDISKVKVYHANLDMNFNRLLLSSLGLTSRLDINDINDTGVLSNAQSQIFDIYFKMPNRTSLKQFQESVSDTLNPSVSLVLPDSVYTGQEFTVDLSQSSDNAGISRFFVQRNHKENSVFNPDTLSTESLIQISYPDTGLFNIGVVAVDPTKNSSSLKTKQILVMPRPQPQNYIVKVKLTDPLLNEGIYGLMVTLKGQSALTDSAGTAILEYLAQSFSDTLRVDRTSEYSGINNSNFPYLVTVSSDTTLEEALFPLVYLDTIKYTDLLDFTRKMNNDGNNIINVWQNLPIQVYKGNPPDPKFEEARQLAQENWKNKTFTWKGRTITPPDYFVDVDFDPNIGIRFEYDSSGSLVDWEGNFEDGGERGHGQDGTPRKAAVHIYLGLGFASVDYIAKTIEHELHHVLDDSGVEDIDDKNASFPNSGYHVSENDSKRVVTIYKLTEFYKSKGKLPELRIYN